jgi:hypothetical protein
MTYGKHCKTPFTDEAQQYEYVHMKRILGARSIKDDWRW